MTCHYCGREIELDVETTLHLHRKSYIHPELVYGPDCNGINCREDEAPDDDCEAMPRCAAYVMVKMPYDSMPDVARVQCNGPEDHPEEEHQFEWIEGNGGVSEARWPKAVAK